MVYGIINDICNGNGKCVNIQIYDLVQAFDSLWLEDCMNDLYDSLSDKNRDDKLALVYKSNVENLVAISTPLGQTNRVKIESIVQQGGSWSSMECSNSTEKIGKLIYKDGEHMYSYKNMVNTLPFLMVDDLLAVAECGIKSVALNTFKTTHIEMKKLCFHTPDENVKSKCHIMHVGRSNVSCDKGLFIYLMIKVEGGGSQAKYHSLSRGRGVSQYITLPRFKEIK